MCAWTRTLTAAVRCRPSRSGRTRFISPTRRGASEDRFRWMRFSCGIRRGETLGNAGTGRASATLIESQTRSTPAADEQSGCFLRSVLLVLVFLVVVVFVLVARHDAGLESLLRGGGLSFHGRELGFGAIHGGGCFLDGLAGRADGV